MKRIFTQSSHWWFVKRMFTTNCVDQMDAQRQTCGPFHERRWRRQVGLNPRWCYSCGVADTFQTGETDPVFHRAGSFLHRCLSFDRKHFQVMSHKLFSQPLHLLKHLVGHFITRSKELEYLVRWTCWQKMIHLPGDENSQIMVSWMCIILWI